MKFQFFKIIGNAISHLFPKNEERKPSKEEAYFQDIFDKFFNEEDYLFCYSMIDEGYMPDKKRFNHLNQVIIDRLNNFKYQYADISEIKSLDKTVKMTGILKVATSLNGQSIVDLILNNTKVIENSEYLYNQLKDEKQAVMDYHNYALKSLENYYIKNIKNERFANTYESEKEKVKIEKLLKIDIVLLRENVFSEEDLIVIQNQVKKTIHKIESKTTNKYKGFNFRNIGKDNLENFSNALDTYRRKVLNNLEVNISKEDILRKVKSYANRNNSNKGLKNLNVQEEYSLPEEIKEKVKVIENLGESINNKEVTDFLSERVPQILKKYFSIDEEYRTTLKNVEGFNAHELMIQSLDNLTVLLQTKKEDNNYNLLSELSIENRKLKVK